MGAKHILVVEDERVVARDIQRSLTDLGYEVPATAATAQQAIRLASERCPDLVLMDIRIKGPKDGIEAAEIIRLQFDVPIVYLTAYADVTTVERAKATEPLGYLMKPVKPNELRSAVELALYKHEAERRLRERERWLSTTLRSIGDAVISTDAEGQITYMNPVAESLTGVRFETAVGRPCREVVRLFDEQSRRQVENPLERALCLANTIKVAGFLANPDDGNRFVTDSAAPIVDDRGRVLGAVMVFRDISEKKRAERRLDIANRMASVTTMAAGLAHELNDPLALVVGNVGVALEQLRCANEETRGSAWVQDVETALLEARAGAERVRQVVSDMQSFTRPAGDVGTINLGEILEQAVEAIGPETRSRVRIVTDFGDTPPVEGESTRLIHGFLNILRNAADAMPPEPSGDHQITVVTSTDAAGGAVIDIHDNGVGMPPDVLNRAFEPFFTTKDATQHPGLGLSICRGIVSSLGGSVVVESREALGTTVRVVLPVARARTAVASAAPQSSATTEWGPRANVLIVEDEPGVRSTLERMIGPAHTLTCPVTAPEALALIDGGKRFDVILSDLMMPELTGMELHAQLLARHPDQARRMVFMSGGACTPQTFAFLGSVPNRHIDKPFESPQLQRLVRELVQEHGPVQKEETS